MEFNQPISLKDIEARVDEGQSRNTDFTVLEIRLRNVRKKILEQEVAKNDRQGEAERMERLSSLIWDRRREVSQLEMERKNATSVEDMWQFTSRITALKNVIESADIRYSQLVETFIANSSESEATSEYRKLRNLQDRVFAKLTGL